MSNEQLSVRADAHCAACDKKFIARWRSEHQIWEDLCPKCLGIAMGAARTDSTVYENCDDKWVQDEPDVDALFIDSYTEEATLGYSGDLLSDDPYHEHGEGAMGDLNLFDKY
jgi:ribosomal protein L37AE/L43A